MGLQYQFTLKTHSVLIITLHTHFVEDHHDNLDISDDFVLWNISNSLIGAALNKKSELLRKVVSQSTAKV